MALEEPGVKSQCREDLRSGVGFGNVRSVEEPWDQIGRRLRESREEMSLSVDDVVHTTRIPRSVVEALEAEDFSVFTSPTYAKSFLRQYSDFLKVDAEPWLNALVPASYVSGTSWQPIFQTPPEPPPPAKGQGKTGRHVEPIAPTGRSSGFSAVATLLLTVALVWGGVQGYRVFEEKFSHEVAAVINPAGKRPEKHHEGKKEAPAPAPETPVANTPGKTVEPVSADHSAEHRAETEVPVMIPRAIIVRD